MWGLAWLTIPLLLTGISIFIGVVRFVYVMFFSKSAKAEKVLAWAEQKKAELRVERERLEATRVRIQKEPPKQGEALTRDLNEKWNKDA